MSRAGRGRGMGDNWWVPSEQQPSFTDVEYGNRRRVSRREQFLQIMDALIPWDQWVGLITPHYYTGAKGRKPKPVETMLRMYLLQVWFSLSDEGIEDAIYDSYAMRRFMGLDFTVEQVPDATTLLHFRHLLEKHQIGKQLFAAQNEMFDAQGWIMRGRQHCRCHADRRAELDQERCGCPGPGDASNQEGQSVVLRDEGPSRGRCRHRLCPQRDRDRRQRPRPRRDRPPHPGR